MTPKNAAALWQIPLFLLVMPASSVFAAGSISLGAAGSYNFDSNVFRTSTNIKQAEYYLASARAEATLDISKLSFRSGIARAFSFYPNVPQNDYEDLSGFGSVIWKTGDRYGADLMAKYSNSHLPRDSIQSGASPNSPLDTLNILSLSANTFFPLPKENYDLHIRTNFSDNTKIGTNSELENKYIASGAAEMQYRYSGKTSLVYGYNVGGSRLKSDLYRYLDDYTQAIFVGARWLTTGKTTSHALIGYENIRFTSTSANSYGGIHIDISAVWKRKSYSQVKVIANRLSQLSLFYGTGFVVTNKLSIDLSHSLTNRWSVGLGTGIYAYQFGNEVKHIGGTMGFSTSFSLRWIRFGMRSGYLYRYSMSNDGTNFSGYTVAGDLIISI